MEVELQPQAYITCSHGAKPSSEFATAKATAPATTRHTSIAVTSHANTAKMSLVSGEKSNFQFILRLLNTNVRPPMEPHNPRSKRWQELEVWNGC